ncbi:MAG: ribosome silencing factor [Bacteroidales bacterium]|nr:ribosome silencing factor [Bacteroidales bacterium]
MVKEKELNTKILVENIIEGIQRKKGRDITIIDLQALSSPLCDQFIICHGDSNKQVIAIAESVEEILKEELNLKAWHKEGYQNAQWVLLDYGYAIIHVFQKETRIFYRLEDLWADGKFTHIEDED